MIFHDNPDSAVSVVIVDSHPLKATLVEKRLNHMLVSPDSICDEKPIRACKEHKDEEFFNCYVEYYVELSHFEYRKRILGLSNTYIVFQGSSSRRILVKPWEKSLPQRQESLRNRINDDATVDKENESVESLKIELEKKTKENEELKQMLGEKETQIEHMTDAFATENDELKKKLRKKETQNGLMTDALARLSVLLKEKEAVQKEMTLTLIELRKAKKRAEKQLKLYRKGEPTTSTAAFKLQREDSQPKDNKLTNNCIDCRTRDRREQLGWSGRRKSTPLRQVTSR